MGTYKLGDAIRKYIDTSRVKNGLRTHQINSAWELMMGKVVASHTDLLKLEGSTLFVKTSVGPLRAELEYQKPMMLKRLNELLGQEVVKKIVVQ